MREVPAFGVEAKRWTVVFHRKAENRFFAAIALGHFKHVSAFAWIPEFGIWTIYDVGFRRTRVVHLADGPAAQQILAAIVTGNATVTVDVRTTDLPWMRLGMFCTSAVAHLVGVRSGALRPDALYRHLVAKGGVVRDDGTAKTTNADGPEPCRRAGAGAKDLARWPADAGAG
jgi:hypothetical protein